MSVIRKLAEVQNGVVVNTIIVDETVQLGPEFIDIDNINPQPGIGWTYTDNTFTYAEAPIPPSPPMTKYHFRSRFTLAKLVALDNFASSTTLSDVHKATLNTITKNFDAADSIDITNSATIQGVEYLVTAGLLTQDRATEILK